MNASTSKRLVMIGAGQFASRCAYYFDTFSDYQIEAFAVDPEYHAETSLDDRPVVSTDDLARQYPAETHAAFVAVGYGNQNRGRSRLSDLLQRQGYELASYHHKTTAIHDSQIGPGTFLADLVSVGPFCVLGRGCILSTSAIVAHDSTLGDECYLSAGSIVAGGTTLGPRCFVGLGARISDGLVIAAETTVGAGAVVVRDITESGTYAGVPARRIA